MTDRSGTPVSAETAALRLAIGQTRQRLAGHLRQVGTLAAPSRLLQHGLEAAKDMAVATVASNAHRVTEAAADAGRTMGRRGSRWMSLAATVAKAVLRRP